MLEILFVKVSFFLRFFFLNFIKSNNLSMETSDRLQKRVLITKADKLELDKKVDAYLRQRGRTNNLHAKYVREIAKQVNLSDDPALDRVRSAVEIPDDPSWQGAFNLCIAFLRRYEMVHTILSIKDEGAIVPRDTGYERASEVKTKFKELGQISQNLGVLTFRDRVEMLAKSGEQKPKKREIPPKKERSSNASRSSHSSRK